MPRAEVFRQIVTARAGGACEYCRLMEIGSGVTFHLEHIFPVSKGGRAVLSNLALSCPGCNFAKAERTNVEDRGGQLQLLFNPRSYEPWLLGWHIHFGLDSETGSVFARTAIGEAIIDALNMNESKRRFARILQIQAGLIS